MRTYPGMTGSATRYLHGSHRAKLLITVSSSYYQLDISLIVLFFESDI